MTARRRISARDLAALFKAHKGRCHLCDGLIHAGEAWERSHPIPLACGGADDETNWAPAHKKCHRVHTSTVDAPTIAKVRRQYQAHIGASRPSGTLRSRGFPPSPPRDKTLTKSVPRRDIYVEAGE